MDSSKALQEKSSQAFWIFSQILSMLKNDRGFLN
jgi:hypothetical protein